MGQNGFGEASALGIGMWQAFLVEVILTFVFVIAIIGVTSKIENAAVAGLVIGLTPYAGTYLRYSIHRHFSKPSEKFRTGAYNAVCRKEPAYGTGLGVHCCSSGRRNFSGISL